MSAATEAHVAARRAALTVHALAAEDRAWMLTQLPPQQRALIEPLLDELRDLGIRVDGRALEPIREESASPASPVAVLGRLDRRANQNLARMLEQEAPEVVRALLASGDPAWRSAILDALDPAFASRVKQPPALPIAPALRAALTAAVERRLADHRANAPTIRSWWRTWNLRRRTA